MCVFIVGWVSCPQEEDWGGGNLVENSYDHNKGVVLYFPSFIYLFLAFPELFRPVQFSSGLGLGSVWAEVRGQLFQLLNPDHPLLNSRSSRRTMRVFFRILSWLYLHKTAPQTSARRPDQKPDPPLLLLRMRRSSSLMLLTKAGWDQAKPWSPRALSDGYQKPNRSSLQAHVLLFFLPSALGTSSVNISSRFLGAPTPQGCQWTVNNEAFHWIISNLFDGGFILMLIGLCVPNSVRIASLAWKCGTLQGPWKCWENGLMIW